MPTPVLAFDRIAKRFGETIALHDASLALHAGEVHALLGENGAGKTTLVRMALGLVRPDRGQVLVDGEAVAIDSPADAARRGIGMVHQHFALADGLSVAENLLLGTAPVAWSRRSFEGRAQALLRRHGSDLDPARRTGDLAVGEKQHLEVVKALERGGRVLILDEPTAVLAPAEVAALFARLDELRAQGRAILLITHKLDEVLAVAQRVTVLRAGRVALTAPRAETSAEAITHALFGEAVGADHGTPERAGLRSPPQEASTASIRGGSAPVLVTRRLAGEHFGPVDLELHAGECVGIAGIDGHGQTDLLETLVGLRIARHGELQRPRTGIAFVSGDRQGTGLALDLPVAENVALKPGLVAGLWWSHAKVAGAVLPLLTRFEVKAASPWQPVRRLSGGNQQKVVLARELAGTPRLVLAENPTRGLDLRATEFVRAQLRAAARAGAAVLLASTDLDEVLAVADRLLVAWRGELHPCARTRDAVAALLAQLAAASAGSGGGIAAAASGRS